MRAHMYVLICFLCSKSYSCNFISALVEYDQITDVIFIWSFVAVGYPKLKMNATIYDIAKGDSVFLSCSAEYSSSLPVKSQLAGKIYHEPVHIEPTTVTWNATIIVDGPLFDQQCSVVFGDNEDDVKLSNAIKASVNRT